MVGWKKKEEVKERPQYFEEKVEGLLLGLRNTLEGIEAMRSKLAAAIEALA